MSRRFIGFSNPSLSIDGRSIAVKVLTDPGDPVVLEIPYQEIGAIIEFLTRCAASGGEPTPAAMSYNPIPIVGLGLATGNTAEETLLVVRLAGCELAYSLASKQVAALGRDFAQTAQVLAASGPHQ
jgi:hypothetical protein